MEQAKKTILISGASIAGLTLAYWLTQNAGHKLKVTIVEISSGLRRGGSPIDVRGEALAVAREMGILEKIKAKEFVHSTVVLNAQNETLFTFEVNAQAEYLGDIEIHRDDLVDILYENIPTDEVEFLFENKIEELIQHEDKVEVTFETGECRDFDLVFGAYFAIVEAPEIKPDQSNSGAIYNEPGKLAVLYPFKKAVNALLVFRSQKLDWDYRNDKQHKEILKAHFESSSWRIPEILDAMLHSDNLYFDEVCQIHMPAWSKGRVALVGDAAHTTSFPTGMGTSLAIQGATILAKALFTSGGDYSSAFAKYYEMFKPYAESVQARIARGINLLVPETEEDIQEAYKRLR